VHQWVAPAMLAVAVLWPLCVWQWNRLRRIPLGLLIMGMLLLATTAVAVRLWAYRPIDGPSRPGEFDVIYAEEHRESLLPESGVKTAISGLDRFQSVNLAQDVISQIL
jgi:hypothetical protein